MPRSSTTRLATAGTPAGPWPTTGTLLLRACLRRAAGPLAAAMTASMIRQCAFLAVPSLIGRAIDDVLASDLTGLLGWCGLLLLAVAVEFLGLCGWIWWANAAEMRIAADLREAMLDVALAAPAESSHRELGGVGDLVERVVDDVDTVLVWVHGLATWVVIATTVVVLVPAIMAMSGVLLAVTGACVALLAVASVAFPRADRPRVARLAQMQGRRSQQVAELLATALTVRGFGGQHRLVDRHHTCSASVTTSRLWVARLRAGWNSTSEALPQLAVAAGLAVGAWQAINGDLAVGQIATFAMWMGTVQRATMAATNRLGAYGTARASTSRMAAVLALGRPAVAHDRARGVHSLDVPARPRAAPPTGLALRGVLVERAGSRIGPVDVTVARGQWCVVTGATGAGKSSILGAMIGLVPSTGRVVLDGVELASTGIDERALAMTLVPQQPLLMHGSVRENLLLGTDSGTVVPDDRLLDACRATLFDEVLDHLPAGLDAAVGERGSHLSGGQRARLAAARALLRPGSVLLFDDISSALDTATEARLLRRLRGATADRIVVWASHRTAVVDASDLTLGLEARS